MKILFINLPYYGHVVPTIGLVQEFIKQGCEVTYLMPFDWKEKVAESGAKFYGYENHRQLSEQMKNAYVTAESIVEQFDLIIYEQFFFLGKHLAEKYNKPVVRIFTAPVTNKKLMNNFITSKGPLSIFKYKWIAKAFTKDIAKDIPMKTDNWLDEIIYNPPELNLVYTLREYQPYSEEFSDKHYKFLGPSIYERKTANLDFVKKERPVIYISLGTVLKGSVSEALIYGTPMVVIPFVSDQPVNAQCVEKLGVGKRLEYSLINKNNLKSTVLSVIRDKDIKRNLDTVQKLMAESLGNKGGAEIIINYFENRI